MMKQLQTFLLLFCMTLPQLCRADWAPAAVQDSLKALYPQADGVAWSHDEAYYVADFPSDGFDVRIWFTDSGRWVMKQTDWQVLDEVPSAVYNAFAAGEYASWQVLDVVWVEFPHWQPLVSVTVGEQNLDTLMQLIYTPNGRLLRVRNVTNQSDFLGASTFL